MNPLNLDSICQYDSMLLNSELMWVDVLMILMCSLFVWRVCLFLLTVCLLPVPGLAPCTKRILKISRRRPSCKVLIQPTSRSSERHMFQSVSKYSDVFCPVETIKLQTSKWMLWAVDANKARLYLNCEPDWLTCASLNCGIYKSAQNKHLRCITSKRRFRVWKKKKPQIWQEDCNQIHSMAMAHHKNVEFSESFVATGVNGVPKPESCTHILHRLKLTLQGLAW